MTRKGQTFIESLPLVNITWLNTALIVVEGVLYWLFVHKIVPQFMTFEDRNVDIPAGLAAPFTAWFGLQTGQLGRRWVLAWNVVCLSLLLSIVVNALLSVSSPFQQFAFEQPNIALGYLPFSWLPTFIVPAVLLEHITSIRRSW